MYNHNEPRELLEKIKAIKEGDNSLDTSEKIQVLANAIYNLMHLASLDANEETRRVCLGFPERLRP